MKVDHTRQRFGTTRRRAGQSLSLLKRIQGWFSHSQPEDKLIDYFVETVEPKLKQVRGYRKRLHPLLQACREHCRSIVAEIPGPVPLKRSGDSDAPILKAAFKTPETAIELLNRADNRNVESSHSSPERVALLTMRSTEKTIFGRKKVGDLILGDCAMRAINFTEHNMVAQAANLADAKKAVENFCLEIITEAAARDLSEIRTRLVDLRQRKEWLSAMKNMFGAQQGMGPVVVPFDPKRHEKKKKLEKMLFETESAIALACNESQTPEQWLTIVEHFLLTPEDILGVQLISLRLDWANVLTDNPDENANTITFATFTLAEEMQREGVFISYEQP